jgi:hypothetical protein
LISQGWQFELKSAALKGELVDQRRGEGGEAVRAETLPTSRRRGEGRGEGWEAVRAETLPTSRRRGERRGEGWER